MRTLRPRGQPNLAWVPYTSIGIPGHWSSPWWMEMSTRPSGARSPPTPPSRPSWRPSTPLRRCAWPSWTWEETGPSCSHPLASTRVGTWLSDGHFSRVRPSWRGSLGGSRGWPSCPWVGRRTSAVARPSPYPTGSARPSGPRPRPRGCPPPAQASSWSWPWKGTT